MYRERKIVRLREYDYSQNGAYAITICVHERRSAFGRVENGEMILHPFGKIAQDHWLALPNHHPHVWLDEFIVMPNHFHAILFLDRQNAFHSKESAARCFGQPQEKTLSTIIGSFKSAVTKSINAQRGCQTRVWQPRFYEHIIRHDLDLAHQRQYIRDNPAQWENDELNPIKTPYSRQ